MLPISKHYSLLRQNLNYVEKSFYHDDTWPNVMKLFTAIIYIF